MNCIAAARSGDTYPGVTMVVESPAKNSLEIKVGPCNVAPAPPSRLEESKSIALYRMVTTSSSLQPYYRCRHRRLLFFLVSLLSLLLFP